MVLVRYFIASTIFFSVDAKCKITLGEPGFPLAAVARGEKVIAGKNETFRVADRDFSKLSVIPDGILVHNIPDCNQNKSDEAEGEYLVEGVKSQKGSGEEISKY